MYHVGNFFVGDNVLGNGLPTNNVLVINGILFSNICFVGDNMVSLTRLILLKRVIEDGGWKWTTFLAT